MCNQCCCCKKEPTCYALCDKRVVSYGEKKNVSYGVKKVAQRKYVSYGEKKTVECGKFTLSKLVKGAQCCECE